MKIFREITPLKPNDVFVILDSFNVTFDYPIHNHAEYEINLVMECSGDRIVGDSIEKYIQEDLVLLGPYLYHKWDRDDLRQKSRARDCRVITIQFGKNLFESSLLSKDPFYRIKSILHQANRGMCFSGQTLEKSKKWIIEMTQLNDLDRVLKFLQLLDFLAQSREYRYLASEVFQQHVLNIDNNRMEIAYQFIRKNFRKPDLKISDVANKLHMANTTFSHFFKKNTNKSFTKFLMDMRLGYACRLLLDTDDMVGNICIKAGFNNLTNFNRLFKKYRNCSPLQYRKKYHIHANFDWSHQLTPYQFVPEDNRIHPLLTPKEYATKLTHN